MHARADDVYTWQSIHMSTQGLLPTSYIQPGVSCAQPAVPCSILASVGVAALLQHYLTAYVFWALGSLCCVLALLGLWTCQAVR